MLILGVCCREEKSFYTLKAQAVDIDTGLPLEPESEFIIKVQDINDNEPRFLDGPYSANVPEMSPTGKTGDKTTTYLLDFYIEETFPTTVNTRIHQASHIRNLFLPFQ